MNCSTCRFELSQCLDGRLASGRRVIVMQHAEACAACGAFWAELQAAQRLTLQLHHPKVGEDFREGLWERIRAGEGTPDAVFHDQVPLLAKLRYGLTGAAAAAAALLFATWSQGTREDLSNETRVASVEQVRDGTHGNGARRDDASRNDARLMPGIPVAMGNAPVDESPMISSTQRLTFSLLALETAKQLEQRYMTASFAVHRVEAGDHGEAVVKQALENADELHSFGVLLLDLRDRQRLFFQNNEIDAELRYAVSMLEQSRKFDRSVQTVRQIVAPALRSKLLGNLAHMFTVKPAQDPREDQDVLLQLNLVQPDVFQKLFFVIGNDEAASHDFGLIRGGRAFFMGDLCTPSWVAPRSAVEAREGFLRHIELQVDGETR